MAGSVCRSLGVDAQSRAASPSWLPIVKYEYTTAFMTQRSVRLAFDPSRGFSST
jgi:hypothetical protein